MKILKKKQKSFTVKVKDIKTRGTWGGVKPYTRVETPKNVYRRKGRRKEMQV